MKISVVTVTYNCVDTIEQTLKSVLDQNYKNLEYIVLDGASTDGTKELIEKYSDKLTFFESKEDKGQYYAIQEGFDMATGEVICYLNGDDILMPTTLNTLKVIFSKFNEVSWITGSPGFLDNENNYNCTRKGLFSFSRKDIKRGLHRFGLLGVIQQESTFYRKNLLEKVGGLDLSLKYACDFKLWKDFAEHEELYLVDVPLGAFRRRPGAQMSSIHWEEYIEECRTVSKNSFLINLIDKFLEKSNLLRVLVKLILHGTANIISYCKTDQCWKKIKLYLPKSTMSFNELRLEFLKKYKN